MLSSVEVYGCGIYGNVAVQIVREIYLRVKICLKACTNIIVSVVSISVQHQIPINLRVAHSMIVPPSRSSILVILIEALTPAYIALESLFITPKSRLHIEDLWSLLLKQGYSHVEQSNFKPCQRYISSLVSTSLRFHQDIRTHKMLSHGLAQRVCERHLS